METIANYPNLKPWKPGQSGNPAGKPPGARHAFSQGFIRDFALVWQEEGLEAVRKVAARALKHSWRSRPASAPTMFGSRLNKPFLGE